MIKHIFSLLIFFALISVVCAEPPLQTFIDGLHIEYPKFEYYVYGSPITFNFHVFNQSGILLTNSSTVCSVQTYNYSSQIDNGPAYFEDDFFRYNLNLSNYDIGTYAYLIACTGTSFGGFVSGTFNIAHDGVTTDTDNLLPSVILLTAFSILFFVAGAYLLFRKQVSVKGDTN